MKIPLLLAVLLVVVSLPGKAEFRTLVSSDGKSIKAELVSHSKGKLTIRREDGNEFEVDPAIFCKQDQEAIAAWMKSEPATLKYDFEISVAKKMRNRETNGEGGSETTWVHEISIRNDAQESVTGIQVFYRVLHESWGENHMMEGNYVLDQNLDFNRTLVVTTDPVTIWRSRDNRNGIKGVLVRILDPKGKVISDWVSKDIGMKDVTWENTTRREEVAQPEERAVIQ